MTLQPNTANALIYNKLLSGKIFAQFSCGQKIPEKSRKFNFSFKDQKRLKLHKNKLHFDINFAFDTFQSSHLFTSFFSSKE